MYFPCLVLPYQRLPGWWYTPESVFTQTIPLLFAGGGCCVVGIRGAMPGRAEGLEVPELGGVVRAGAATGGGAVPEVAEVVSAAAGAFFDFPVVVPEPELA